LLILFTASVAAAEGELPSAVTPYVPLVDKCEQFDTLTVATGWQVVHDEDFDPTDKPGWTTRQQANVTAETVTADHRSAVRLSVPNGPAMLYINEPASGDFAIQIVARSTVANPCDLSLATDGLTDGPAFQFGGYMNSRNQVWTNANPRGNRKFNAVQLPADVRIEPNTWHTVRMEVADGQVRCLVDGNLIGIGELSDTYDADKKRTPIIYTWQSTVEIDRFTIEKPVDAPEMQQQAVMRELFGETDEAQIRKQIDALGELLDADDYATREAAHQLLQRAGPFAKATVLRLAEQGTPEQKWRAVHVGRALGIIEDEQAAAEDSEGQGQNVQGPIFQGRLIIQ